MKKTLCIIIALVCILATVPTMVFGAKLVANGTTGTVAWKYYDDGLLEFTGTGEMADTSVYTSVPWYTYRNSITSVSIAEGITKIGANAFSHCTQLKSVTIPSTVVTIGDYAFTYSGITSITIPANVKTIGAGAFSYCSGLANVTIPSTVETIGASAFKASTALVSADLSAFSGDIPEMLFQQCSLLSSVSFPANCTAIGKYAFSETALTSVEIPTGVKTIGMNAFYKCAALQSATISSTVETIDKYAFEQSGLKSITVPSTVKAVNEYAFRSCTSLETAVINANAETLGDELFRGCTALTSVTLPTSLKNLGTKLFQGCTSLVSVSLPLTVTTIGQYAFEGCTKLKNVNVPANATSVGTYAFANCSSLEQISFPEGVTVINDDVFNGCSSLKAFEINETVTDIGKEAFKGCSSLTEIVCPASVKTIGANAFDNCTGLTKVDILNSAATLDAQTFLNCANITKVTVPSAAQTIGFKTLFPSYAKITDVTYASGTTEIYNSTPSAGLDACTAVKYVAIPKTVTVIDNDAFLSTTALTDVFYEGTEDEWGEINIGGIAASPNNQNQNLLNATMHYNAEGIHVHTFGAWEKDDEQNHKRECECGDIEYENHKWDYGVMTEEPTTTEKGTMLYTCTVCGETKEEDIPEIEVEFNASYTMDANEKTVKDGDTITYKFTPEEGSKGATGVIYFLPSSNLEFISATADGANVTLEQVVEGEMTGAYTYLLLERENETIPTLELKFKYVAHTGCNTISLKCSIPDLVEKNGYSVVFFINNTAHTSELKIISHTFTEWQKHDALQHKKVCDCGAIEYENHIWNEGEITTEPTALQKGVKTYTCTVCGQTRTEEIENIIVIEDGVDCSMVEKNEVKYVTGVKYNSSVTEARKIFKNQNLKFVDKNGADIAETGLVGTGSKAQILDSQTGNVVREIVFIVDGDLDGDGHVKSNDALLALKQSAGIIVGTDATLLAGDLDGNGKITSAEALKILKCSAGISALH